MKNPLRKRYLRELRSDFGKYLVIFLLMVLSIGEISGFLVSDGSMIKAYNEAFEKYNIEDGFFISEKKLNERQIQAIRESGAEVYPLYSTDRPMTNGTTLRMFAMREEVDLACLMEGAFPEKENEIAIDRMYADNNGLKIGDTMAIAAQADSGQTDSGQTDSSQASGMTEYTISGLVALSDYSAMFENNNDMMFDAKEFGVAVLTKEGFGKFDRDLLTWRYAWKYDDAPADEKEENERSEEFIKKLSGIVNLTEYIPRYQNQAIMFTGDDMGSDRGMMHIFLVIIILILAFVFAVTTSNTIVKEAAVIGTLRASGYTKNELIRHYMTMPLLVTLIAALVGNILGYTVLKDFNVDLYYNSYSLPTYVTIWDGAAFIETTVIPLIMMLVINYVILRYRLQLSPLQFLRRDLRKKQSRGAIPLSKHLPFFSRFRMRIFMQNFSSYLVLAIGILFANFLLLFGLMLPDVLNNYMEALPDNMFCNYQYILQIPAGALNEDKKVESLINMLLFQNAVETDNTDAEKFSAWQLRTCPDEEHPYKEEDLLVYGIDRDSRYIDLNFPENAGETAADSVTSENQGVYISRALSEKWKLAPGDEFTLKEPFEDTYYTYTVSGVYPYDGALCLFMEREALNEAFKLGEDSFSGYFSDSEVTDIDEAYIGQRIDFTALSKVSRQLVISFGGMMYLVDIFSVIMFMILIYLLSKIIIEKNAVSISMTKILGYRTGEIARLYIMVTSIIVFGILLLSIPIDAFGLQEVFREMIRQEMTGWIPFVITNSVYVKMMLYGIVTYAVVAVLEFWKIRNVPMGEALKQTE